LSQNKNTSLAIIKLGRDGCLLVTSEHHTHVPGFAVDVRDTAGAGDSFASAVIYGYLRNWSLEEIGILGNAVGAMVVAKLGTGTMLPQRSEIVALLARHGHTLLTDDDS
ncbi:MAG: carbohydrate kinase family protein, partial [Chloroflexota bacterium]